MASPRRPDGFVSLTLLLTASGFVASGMTTKGTPVVEPWFAALPITDSRCRNDSCKAFKAAHTASQAQISWASQFLYGQYLTWYYLAMLGVFVAVFASHQVSDRRNVVRSASAKPGLVQKVKASIRLISYRRVPGKLGLFLGLPSTGTMIWMLLALVAVFAMSFAQHPYYRQFRGYGSPPLGVRTGLMAAAMFPITIALAGKVNVITMLTGFGYEKLNVWHRYAGYVMFLLSTIHSIPFLWQQMRETGAQNLRVKFYTPGSLEFSGAPAWAFSFGLAAFSLPIIRRSCYEVFIHSHIWIAIAFLGLCFWHFDNEGDSWDYLWATVAIWAFQIVVRTFWKTSAFKISEPWFSGLPTSARRMHGDMVRLEVAVPEHWSWKPGQHVFLRFPRLNPLDNHPFTITSTPRRGSLTEKARGHNVMTFLIRRHGGSTKHMASYLEKTPDAQLSTIVDGPYGTIARRYERCADKVILVAGGNGITSCLPWLLHLSREMRRGGCSLQSITLIWAMRNFSHTEWVASELQEALETAPAGTLDINFYITDERDYSSDSDGIEDMKTPQRVHQAPLANADGVQIHHVGRPVLRTTLATAVGSGRTAVLGCGPDNMKIDLSNAVAGLQSRVLRGEAREIMLHTETFDW